MAKITDQNIPSELQDLYSTTLETQPWIYDEDRVCWRHPFRIPTLQGCRTIRPPIPRGAKVTDAMCAHRHVFGDCVRCFQRQPVEGGAVPPDWGPRNRSWWYADPENPGFWYYCWFMYKTIKGYVTGKTPDWCRIKCEWSTWAVMPTLTNPNCNHPEFNVRWNSESHHVAWTKSPLPTARKMIISYYNAIDVDGVGWPCVIKVYEVHDGWGCSEVTGDKNPKAGRHVGTLVLEDRNYGLREINIDGGNRFVLVCETWGWKIGFGGYPSKYGPAFA